MTSPTEPGDHAPRIGTAAPEILDEIRSLHARIDELHGLVAQRLEAGSVHTAGKWLGGHATLHQVRALPAWRPCSR
jgi:hypothetical protein